MLIPNLSISILLKIHTNETQIWRFFKIFWLIVDLSLGLRMELTKSEFLSFIRMCFGSKYPFPKNKLIFFCSYVNFCIEVFLQSIFCFIKKKRKFLTSCSFYVFESNFIILGKPKFSSIFEPLISRFTTSFQQLFSEKN